MTTWLTLAAAAVGTYLLRISMVVAFADRPVPERIERHLRLAAPAVLAAVLATSLVAEDRQVRAPDPGQALAVLAAVTVVRRGGRPLQGLAAGLVVAVLAAAVGLT